MKSIFDPIPIGGLDLKNRIVRSATAEMAADVEGRITGAYMPIYRSLAEGGVGVIITGMMSINKKGRIGILPNTYNDSFVQDFQSLVEMVHSYGCKLIVQLVHCGVKAAMPEESDPPLGPSETVPPARPARAMAKRDIVALAEDFARAAARCKEAGADGVQIHAAHGYLISQFLSPSTNKREDEYGGDIANRGRILFEVYDAVRRATGEGFPLWIKINCTDLVEESITLEECIWLCGEMEKRGLDAIELSAGMGHDRNSSPSKRIMGEEDEGSFASEAVALAEKVSIPVISTGGFRSPAVIETWLNKGGIEAIGFSRALICEPDLASRWEKGDKEKARCVSCSRCYRPKAGYGCQVFSKE